MIKNVYRGILVAFDGPNGVGKTTIIERLKIKLECSGYCVEKTKEPSQSSLGDFVRLTAECVTGYSLACLVTADRYEHIESELKNLLKHNQVILCDRYILSSLILQPVDGVAVDYIMKLNENIIKPDIQIALHAPENIIKDRLNERAELTRFERDNNTKQELINLKDGLKVLSKYNISTYDIDTSEPIEKNIEMLFEIITNYIR